MPLQQIPFQSQDGVENLLSLAQAQGGSAYTLLCLPAMGVSAAKYHAFIETLAESGLTAATYDLRGNGNSSVRASRQVDFSYADLVEQDLPAAMEALTAAYPDSKIVLLGHSLGGQMASLYLGRQPDAAVGLILPASCTVYFKGWPNPRRWMLLLFTQFAALLAKVMGYFPGHSLNFGGREARSVMRDWAYNARTGKYRLADSKHDYEASLTGIKVPVLAINFSNDDFAPTPATRNLLQKLSSLSDINMIELSGEDMGLTRADHFNWLKQPQKVCETINNWVKSHL